MRIRWIEGSAYRLMRSGLEFLPVTSATLRFAGSSLLIAATLAGCSQPPGKRSKEFFPSSIYGAASPKVVEDGQPVPKGGGRYLVGRPYTVAGRTYVPKEVAINTSQTGRASWYGSAFHGRRTSNGEVYDMRSVTAAHPTWPLPSYVRVTNVHNGRSMIVRLNDRGPFHSDRIMDVSSRVADALDFKRTGTGTIKVDYLGPAGLAGSDDQILMASLRTDGRPAQLDKDAQPTMIAEAAPAKKTEPEGPHWSFFKPSEPDAGETSVVARQETEALSPAGAGVLPPPRPASLGPAAQQTAAMREPAPVVASAAPEPSAASFAPSLSNPPSFPPLPPARPLSLR